MSVNDKYPYRWRFYVLAPTFAFCAVYSASMERLIPAMLFSIATVLTLVVFYLLCKEYAEEAHLQARLRREFFHEKDGTW